MYCTDSFVKLCKVVHVEKNNPATVNYCVIHEYSILSQKYKYGIEFKHKFLVQTCLDLYQFLAHANMHSA